MNINKKCFMELMNKITKENDLNKFDIIIWHGASIDYDNALYIELMFTVNGESYARSFNEEINYDLYYGEDLEDTDDNLKVIYKLAKEFQRKIKNWIKGTWLESTKIVIEEENV